MKNIKKIIIKVLFILIPALVLDIIVISAFPVFRRSMVLTLNSFVSSLDNYLTSLIFISFGIGFLCSMLLAKRKSEIVFKNQLPFLFKDLFSPLASRWQFSWAVLGFTAFALGIILGFLFDFFSVLPLSGLVLIANLFYILYLLYKKYIKQIEI